MRVARPSPAPLSAALIAASSVLGCVDEPPRPAGDLAGHKEESAMRLNSVGLVDGERIPDHHACTSIEHLGQSPDLRWTTAPKGTAAFAVTLIDESADGFVHWALLNLPPTTHVLPRGARGDELPEGTIELDNDFGHPGYGGPCPPPGDPPHTYVFTVYALKSKVTSYATGQKAPRGLDEMLRAKLALASASLTVSWDR